MKLLHCNVDIPSVPFQLTTVSVFQVNLGKHQRNFGMSGT